MSYDLCIGYRIYPGISKKPKYFADDKLVMSEFCLWSLKNSLGSLKAKLIVHLDKCPPEYKKVFLKYFDEQDIDFIELPGLGNQEVMKILWDNLIDQKYSEYVYLAEDDYIYTNNSFFEGLELLKKGKNIDAVSLYDHIDYYFNNKNDIILDFPNTRYKNYNDFKSNIIVTPYRHWRSVKSTCMTFLTTRKLLKSTRNVLWNNLDTYPRGAYDYSFWIALTKIQLFSLKDFMYFKILLKTWFCGFLYILFGKKINIYSPMDSIATHIESTGIAPIIDYDEIYKQFLKETGKL